VTQTSYYCGSRTRVLSLSQWPCSCKTHGLRPTVWP